MKESRPVPIVLLAGALGAGKTTLLRRLLADPGGRRLAVVVNDFGPLAIDAALVADVAGDTIALANGCLCCSARDDLAAAALALARAVPPPDAIVVETSGVADANAVLRAFTTGVLGRRFVLESACCVVDAASFPALTWSESERVIDQAAAADLVLLNKADLVGADALASIERDLTGALPGMRVVRSVHCDLPGALLAMPRVEPGDATRRRRRRAHSSGIDTVETHDARWTAGAWHARRPIDAHAFAAAVDALPQAVVRAKALLAIAVDADRRDATTMICWQRVGRRSTLERLERAPGRETPGLVALWRTGTLDRPELDARFASCGLEPVARADRAR